jgi:hypothetical protein
MVLKSVSLKLLELSGPVKACNGIAFYSFLLEAELTPGLCKLKIPVTFQFHLGSRVRMGDARLVFSPCIICCHDMHRDNILSFKLCHWF